MSCIGVVHHAASTGEQRSQSFVVVSIFVTAEAGNVRSGQRCFGSSHRRSIKQSLAVLNHGAFNNLIFFAHECQLLHEIADDKSNDQVVGKDNSNNVEAYKD
jgi:hypothetical protein